MAITFNSVFPIGATDPNQIPMRDRAEAVSFYTQTLGFTLVSEGDDGITLRRDSAEIHVEKNDIDPSQASCYFSVSEVDTLHTELTDKGAKTSSITNSEHDGKTYRVFFVQLPDGVCYCFGQPA